MRRVIFLLHASGLCGGIKIVCELASRLSERGYPAEIWAPAPSPQWFKRALPWKSFRSLYAMGNELRRTRADKIATWNGTADWAVQTIKEDDRGYYLIQDNEVTYTPEATRTYDLGLIPITLGKIVTEWVRSLGQNPHEIGIAIDHDIFRPLDIERDRNRVFVPFRPADGPDDLKGWGMAHETLQLAKQMNPALSVVTFGKTGGPIIQGIPHIHVRYCSDHKLCELYSQCGVFLFPSRHEGFGLPALEAMACGAHLVTRDAWGNMEFCRHGVNCAVGHSAKELAGHISDIQDVNLLPKMQEAAIATALGYQWDRVIDRLVKVFSL